MLPRRRKRSKSGIERAPQRRWPKHKRWVKSHGCCVLGCTHTDIDPAHWRSAANAGTGLTPHDMFLVSLCRMHHDEQHRIGQPGFEKKYGIDMHDLSAEFARRSPDWEMRQSIKEEM